MRKKVISAISFFFKGERLVVECRPNGKFKVPVTNVSRGRPKTVYKNLSAREIIEHEVIKDCDPTLYLETGDRLRVFVDGDNKYLPAQAEGLIEKHDKVFEPKKFKIPPTLNLDSSKTRATYSILDVYAQTGFFGEDWDDWGNED
jgi:hypothetical protein